MAASNSLAAGLDYAMLLNLVSASNASDRDTLWGFIERYAPGLDRETQPELDALVTLAIRYYEDFVRPTKRFKVASVEERAMLADLDAALVALPPDADAATIQSAVYEVGRAHFPDSSGKAKTPDGRPGVSQAFFQTLYRVLLGQERGPRFGSFVEIYGSRGDTRADRGGAGGRAHAACNGVSARSLTVAQLSRERRGALRSPRLVVPAGSSDRRPR